MPPQTIPLTPHHHQHPKQNPPQPPVMQGPGPQAEVFFLPMPAEKTGKAETLAPPVVDVQKMPNGG